MLLGIPSSVNLSHNPDPRLVQPYFGGYLQDDWKIARNFTINLGLRYEFDVPRTERFNRLALLRHRRDLAARRRRARQPLLRSVAAQGRGASSSTTTNRRQVATDYNNVSPRIGFAWNFAEKTVIRGGYGIFYMPSHVQAAGHSGSSGMIGFNTQSDMIVSLDSNRTPLRTIDNPFPDGFNLPPGTRWAPRPTSGSASAAAPAASSRPTRCRTCSSGTSTCSASCRATSSRKWPTSAAAAPTC